MRTPLSPQLINVIQKNNMTRHLETGTVTDNSPMVMERSVTLPLAIIQLENPPQQVIDSVGAQPVWFVQALDLAEDQYIIVRPHLGEALPEPGTISAAILTGSWAMVTDRADWSERTAEWVRGAMARSLPLLGVCYGHQLMAYALGGQVGDNPNGWERGLQQLTVATDSPHDPLVASLPPRFTAWLSHRQSVLVPPGGAEVLAGSAQDRCQIIRYSAHALSVQFHPEFTQRIMSACLRNSVGAAQASETLAGCQEPEWSLRILQDFWHQQQSAAERTPAFATPA